jgi:hypothetical protein
MNGVEESLPSQKGSLGFADEYVGYARDDNIMLIYEKIL